MLEITEIKDNYTSTAYQRALSVISKLDAGKTLPDAYFETFKTSKRNNSAPYRYITQAPFKQALSDFYKHNLPPWATNKDGLSGKIAEIHAKGLESDNLEIARKSIMDIAKLQGLTDNSTTINTDSVTLDLRQLIVNSNDAKYLQEYRDKANSDGTQPTDSTHAHQSPSEPRHSTIDVPSYDDTNDTEIVA